MVGPRTVQGATTARRTHASMYAGARDAQCRCGRARPAARYRCATGGPAQTRREAALSMPTLAFARAVGREPVDLVGCHAATVHQSNVLVDSISASAGALDPQTLSLIHI